MEIQGAYILMSLQSNIYIMVHHLIHFSSFFWCTWQIVLIQVALPALISLKGHKKLKREVDELGIVIHTALLCTQKYKWSLTCDVIFTVGRVNHMFASTDYLPVQYLNHSIDDVELCALYSIAHAQIVTYQRGGMPSSVPCILLSKHLFAFMFKFFYYHVGFRIYHLPKRAPRCTHIEWIYRSKLFLVGLYTGKEITIFCFFSSL